MTKPRTTKARNRCTKFFLPFQAAWIQDRSRLKLMEKSRQIGISWASAYEDVMNASTTEHAHDVWVSSRDEIQARLYLEDCKKFAAIYTKAAKDLGEIVLDDEQRTKSFAIEFANGKRVNSMSSNPNAQAGKRGHRKLDEFALHPDPRALYSIAYPGITWGGSMAIISTHRGSANFFNELIEDVRTRGNKKGFSLHRVTLQDALDQGFLHKLQGKLAEDDPRQDMDEAQYFDFIRAGCADEESFLQEYMCVPANDAAAFLSYDLIAASEYPATEMWATDLADIKNGLFVGVDVGRDHDLTVIWVLERVGGVQFTRRIIELKAQPFDVQEAALYSVLSLPQVRRCCIDQTGIGRQFAERAKTRFGYKVEGIAFTGSVKEELAYPVRAAFEDRSVRVPRADAIRADLRSIRKEVTSSGNIRFAADRGKNGHADRFWALALAMHAGKIGESVPMLPHAFTKTAGARSLANRRLQGVLA